MHNRPGPPGPDRQGLTPNQFAALLDGNWRTTGAIRLNPDLTTDQANQAWAFRAALGLLTLIRDHGPATTTATGNLSRQFVAQAMEALEFPAGYVDDVRRYNKVINETDVGLLHHLRTTLVSAGYIRRHKGFRVTATGRAALTHAASHPGPIFVQLFLARMGIEGLLLAPDGPNFRSPIGPALYRLGHIARDWTEWLQVTQDLLAPDLFPGDTKWQLSATAYQWVVGPCIDFGLVAHRTGPKPIDPSHLRVTPLFDEFIRFRLPEEPVGASSRPRLRLTHNTSPVDPRRTGAENRGPVTSDVGRNDPCPCGSGRKYKRCCLRNDDATALAYSDEDRTNGFAKLLKYARRPEFDSDRRLAEEMFWSDRLDRMPPDVADEIGGSEPLLVAFLTWLGFDFELTDGPDLTLAQRLLRTRAGDLTTGERTWLERMADSSLRLFEITDVRPDEGLSLTDLRSGERLDVSERLATHQLTRWDVLAVRVIAGPAGALILAGHVYSFPRDLTESLRREIKQHERAFTSGGAHPDEALFAKSLGVVLHHLWLDLAVNRPLPKVFTNEGDELVFTKAVFDVTDAAAVSARLKEHPDLVATDDGYTWVERSGEMERVLGSVTVDHRRLTLETQSAERAARGRALLESALGEVIRYRVSTSQSVEQALSDSGERKSRRRPESEIPPEIQQQIVGDFYERHYRSWLDESIPALGGRTPRQAVRLKTVRPQVVDLIKGIENQMRRERAAGRPAIEVDWLWTELGLSPD